MVLPDDVASHNLAPLLCSGIIGYRALQRAHLPPGGRLGIYGFGASAHLTAQVAIARGSPGARPDPVQVGATVGARPGGRQRRGCRRGTAGTARRRRSCSPRSGASSPWRCALLTGAAGSPLPGIYLSDIPGLSYEDELFYEKELVSVTANTRVDGEELLAIAAQTGLQVRVSRYAFEAADEALDDLAADRITGAAVLQL